LGRNNYERKKHDYKDFEVKSIIHKKQKVVSGGQRDSKGKGNRGTSNHPKGKELQMWFVEIWGVGSPILLQPRKGEKKTPIFRKAREEH